MDRHFFGITGRGLAAALLLAALCGAACASPEPKGGRTVNAVDFGADPTGRRESTSALQAAVDSLCEAGGGTLAISAGEFRIVQSTGVTWGLVVACDNVYIRGAGRELTRLVGDPTTTTDGRNLSTMIRFFETNGAGIAALSADGSWNGQLPGTGWAQLVRYMGVDGVVNDDVHCVKMSNHCVSVRVSDAVCRPAGGTCARGERCCDSGFNANAPCTRTAECARPSRDGVVSNTGCVGCNGASAIVWSKKKIGVKNERIVFRNIYGRDAVRFHGFECRYSKDCLLEDSDFSGNNAVGVNVEEGCDNFRVTNVTAADNGTSGMKTQGFDGGHCVAGGGSCAPPARCCDDGWNENAACSVDDECFGGRPTNLVVSRSKLVRNGEQGFLNIRADGVRLVEVELADNGRNGFADQPNVTGNPLDETRGTRIVDCSIHDNALAGVRFRDTADVAVEGGSIYGNQAGVDVLATAVDVRVAGVEFRDNADADVLRRASSNDEGPGWLLVPEPPGGAGWVDAARLPRQREGVAVALVTDAESRNPDKLTVKLGGQQRPFVGMRLDADSAGTGRGLRVRARVKLVHDDDRADGARLAWRAGDEAPVRATLNGPGRWQWVEFPIAAGDLSATEGALLVGLRLTSPADGILIDGFLLEPLD